MLPPSPRCSHAPRTPHSLPQYCGRPVTCAVRLPPGVEHFRSLVCAAFEDTVEDTDCGSLTQRNQDYVWRVGDEASRADILAGCRTRKETMRPLILGIYREEDSTPTAAGGKELLVDFNASSVQVGWHYHW